MKHSADLKTRLHDLIQDNIDQFLQTEQESLKKITVDDIRRQNKYSSRFGGQCTIEYENSSNGLQKRSYWIKKVENPERFYSELTDIYNTLQRNGLHSHMTRPYLYDPDSGAVCISHFDGVSLLKETFRHSFSFGKALPQELIHVFNQIGRWLQMYHEATISENIVTMPDILLTLLEVLEKDSSLSSRKKAIIMKHLSTIRQRSVGTMTFPTVRTHNDFTLRNILVSNDNFGVIDWDAMIHPKFPDLAPVWNEISCFLLNLQSLLRFYPIISKYKIRVLKDSFLQGYFEGNSLAEASCFPEIFYIFSLRFFLGIDSDRPLAQIYRKNFGKRYIQLLEKELLLGNADLTNRLDAGETAV